MKFNQIIILLLSFSILLTISCSNEGTTGTKEKTIADYAGNWYSVSQSGETSYWVFTINTSGSVTVVGMEGATIDASSIIRNSDTNYSFKINDSTYEFTFVSDDQLAYKGDGYETTLRKKEQ